MSTDILVSFAALLIILVAFAIIATGFVIAVWRGRRLDRYLRSSKEELHALRSSGHYTDLRFDYLLNNTTDAVSCYEFNPPIAVDLPLAEQLLRSHGGILSRCNVVFANVLGAKRAADVIGSQFGSLNRSKDEAVHSEYYTAFIENGYRLSDFELNFTNSEGKRFVSNLNMTGALLNGCLQSIWTVESNTLGLIEFKAANERRQTFQKQVAAVSSQLVKVFDEDADSVVEDCLQNVGRFLNVDRAAIFWLGDEPGSFYISHLWSQVGDPVISAMTVDSFPRIFEQLVTTGIVQVDDVRALPPDYKTDFRYLTDEIDVKSFVVVAKIIANEVVGGMVVSRVHERKAWSDRDMEEIRAFADIFCCFVSRLHSSRALDNALLGLQQATDRLEAENIYLREEIELTHGFDEIIGQSNAILRSLQLVEQVANTTTPVLLLGETGTGKELVARAIHDLSDRHDRPLVKVNCAALPANLIESELFGHEKGAFTGADRTKLGRFDLAAGSTLFLDEIAEIPVELQAKLLRVLQEGEFERLGGTKTISVDVRVVAATNQDIYAAVRTGEFRSDLFYRINTFPIELPALRDRGGDVQLLARHFVRIHAQRLGRDVSEISAEMMRQFDAYHWPGNVRELEGIIQRALISSRGPVLNLAEPLVATAFPGGVPRIISSSVADLKLVERDHIVSVLDNARWKISGASGAAALLGVPPSTLRSKMKKLGITRPS